MFSLLSVRLATRFIAPSLSAARPRVSRAVFLSHAQTRSFLTTPRLTAAKATASTPARKTVAKPKAKTAKKKRVVSAKKKSVKKKVLVKKKVPAKPKRVTVSKDMMPPKQPPMPYIIFFSEYNAKLPKVSSMEAMAPRSRDCGVAWNNLPDAEKQTYHEKYNALREDYLKERAEWFKRVDPKVLRELNKRYHAKGKRRMHKPKDPAAPKRPLTSFMYFIQDYRNSNPVDGLPATKIGARAGETWRGMSDEAKQPYIDRSREAIAAARSSTEQQT